VDAALLGRAGKARRRVLWRKKLAGMLVEPGSVDDVDDRRCAPRAHAGAPGRLTPCSP